MKAYLRSYPSYAFVLPFIPAAKIFGGNADRVSLSLLAPCLALSIGLYIAGRTIARRLLADGELADLLWAVLFIGLFMAGYVFPVHGNEALWFGLLAILLVAVVRIAELRKPASLILTAFFAVVVGLPTWQALNSPVWTAREEIRTLAASVFPELPEPAPGSDIDRRDIYYLIFDRYARSDQLKDIYGYDNEPFIRELRKRGFKVADQSFSNYQRTTHSLISSLNLGYLDRLDQKPASSSADWLPLYEMLEDFRLRRFLEKQGYAFHFFGGWWEPTRINRLADENHNWRAWPEPFRIMLEASLIPFFGKLAGVLSFDQRWVQCQRSKRAFEELKNLAPGKFPQFVFAHFLVPHPPFVMDESGRCVSEEEARAKSRAWNYVQQVKYTNSQILAFLDSALKGPGPKPIIILQADEGPWPKRFAGDEIGRLGADVTPADWLTATRSELIEKMAILNAVYLPDRQVDEFVDTSTPVNTFRTVLRQYFGVPLTRLPDRQIIFESADRLYRFHDITESLAAESSFKPASQNRLGLRPAFDQFHAFDGR